MNWIAPAKTSNQVVDMRLLTQTMLAAMDTFGVGQIEVVADRSYFKVEDSEACGKDVYVCPAGQHLSRRYEKKTRDLKLVEYCNREACRSCDLKAHCTHG